MARAACTRMVPTQLLREREFAHFTTRLFDRADGSRIHMHSGCGLHHADCNVRQILSHEDDFRTMLMLFRRSGVSNR
jgi:serine/threonine-protein kinase HipA